MTTPPQISEADIRARVGAQSLQRGRSYANNGRVIATRRHGNTLQGLCLGSRPVPYRLHVTINPDGTVEEADCSCPVGDGGYCKHVAALLLVWLSHPEAFDEAIDIETALQVKSKEELIQLLLTVSEGNPQFAQLLETAVESGQEGASPGAEFYRQQVETAIEPLEYRWDFSSGGYGYGGEVPAIVTQGDEKVQRGDWRGAADVYRGVLEGLRESQALAYDEEGGLVEAVWRSIEGLGVCLDNLDEPADREPILNTLFETFYIDISVLGGVDLSIGIPEMLVTKTTPAERDELIERVQEIMPSSDDWGHDSYQFFLQELEAEKLTGEDYLDRSRELGLIDRLVDRLLSLGRHDEAVQEAAEADTNELEMLVPIFTKHEQADLIEPLVQRRLAKDAPPYYGGIGHGLGVNLETWLMGRYKERGDDVAALELALRMLGTRPSMELYQEARELATRAGEWPAKRKEIMGILNRQSPGLKVLIQLDEGELDEAISAVRRRGQNLYYTGVDIPLRVADSVAEERPDAALDIYLREITDLIEARGRENYQMAATLLGRMRKIYDDQGRFEEWETLIERLRSDHSRLPAFQDELNRAGL